MNDELVQARNRWENAFKELRGMKHVELVHDWARAYLLSNQMMSAAACIYEALRIYEKADGLIDRTTEIRSTDA